MTGNGLVIGPNAQIWVETALNVFNRFWKLPNLLLDSGNFYEKSFFARSLLPGMEIFVVSIKNPASGLFPGGVLGISSDGGDRMEPKVKTPENP